jgi:hypothetical protein
MAKSDGRTDGQVGRQDRTADNWGDRTDGRMHLTADGEIGRPMDRSGGGRMDRSADRLMGQRIDRSDGGQQIGQQIELFEYDER